MFRGALVKYGVAVVIATAVVYGVLGEDSPLIQTDRCGVPQKGDTMLYFAAQEFGYNGDENIQKACGLPHKTYTSTQTVFILQPAPMKMLLTFFFCFLLTEEHPEVRQEQILLQLFRPKKLPFVIEEVCSLMFLEDRVPQNSTDVNMVIFSSDPSVDLTKNLPRPLKELRRGTVKIYHTRVVPEARRWWYSVILDEGLVLLHNKSIYRFIHSFVFCCHRAHCVR